MAELVYTLLADGPSDRRLMRPIDWLLTEAATMPFRGQWGDVRAFAPLRHGLAARIGTATELFPCDLLLP